MCLFAIVLFAEKFSPCSISCISKSDKTIKSATLADGAPCHLDESLDVCHQGQCLVSTIDSLLYSNKPRIDRQLI